jgi:hypothetical protein
MGNLRQINIGILKGKTKARLKDVASQNLCASKDGTRVGSLVVAIQPIAVALRHNLCQSGRAKIVLADTLSGLDDRQSALNHIQHPKICNNTIYNTCASERQAAGR